ncbi:MAG: hypothetical protein JXR96_20130 [Deltaproteobacteria bacterium]|nr:hypothetical protein [Deltaproteobacteria bacterium]
MRLSCLSIWPLLGMAAMSGCASDDCPGCECRSAEDCADGQYCDVGTHTCVDACNPKSCGELDRACGDWPDGCGATLHCGDCPAGRECDADGQCECAFAECSGTCCAEGQVCDTAGACCSPGCEGRQCGPDGCGGSCGQCADGSTCNQSTGRCVADPQCETAADCAAKCGSAVSYTCRADETCLCLSGTFMSSGGPARADGAVARSASYALEADSFDGMAPPEGGASSAGFRLETTLTQ